MRLVGDKEVVARTQVCKHCGTEVLASPGESKVPYPKFNFAARGWHFQALIGRVWPRLAEARGGCAKSNLVRQSPTGSSQVELSQCAAVWVSVERRHQMYESWTHSLPLVRPSRASGFAQIPFVASQAAQVDMFPKGPPLFFGEMVNAS